MILFQIVSVYVLYRLDTLKARHLNMQCTGLLWFMLGHFG